MAVVAVACLAAVSAALALVTDSLEEILAAAAKDEECCFLEALALELVLALGQKAVVLVLYYHHLEAQREEDFDYLANTDLVLDPL